MQKVGPRIYMNGTKGGNKEGEFKFEIPLVLLRRWHKEWIK